MHKKDQLVWLDETGTNNHNYYIHEKVCMDIQFEVTHQGYHRSLSHGTRTSIITALSTEGLVTMELINRNPNADKLCNFVRGSLVPYI